MSPLWIKICGLRDADAARAAAEAGADAIGFVFAPSPRRVDPDTAGRIVAAVRRAVPAGGVLGGSTAPGGGTAEGRPLAVVGVFVNAPVAEMVAVARHAGLTHIQLHGDEPEAVVAALQEQGLAVIRAVGLAPRGSGPNAWEPGGHNPDGGTPGVRRHADHHPDGRAGAADHGAGGERRGIAWEPTGPDAVEVAARAIQTRADLVLVDAAVPGQRGGTGRVADWTAAARLARQRPVILAGGLRPDNVAEAVRVVRPWGVDVSSGVERARGVKDPQLIVRFIEAARAAVPAR
ncbi:Phosphoribosylanthranilate isomerase [Thermaerobacter marianensis DSM 12885]|uniref:N-(5'-phosphoribosyl)anthranilate isomerase n=1 Tax=Thermaerobacter marianensis (strain ATCC 700841 / DSM 12885 / JCM 10246 / 7p75a) TaxID=644966 RepID=E6SGB3_THEM7|nr:phosphoribosylanthranilate isomerase [Thermaerobacter marianensis]ADU51565.1 Phosphoribosylanthranilate isomerase [Thermaerobacter marianensis DSM 12885]